MTDELLTYCGTVYPWQCDHMGHMNVMWYVGKFDEATWQMFSALGLTPAFLRENFRGIAAVEQTIAYKRELLAGDVIKIRSSIIEVRSKAVRFQHEMATSDTSQLTSSTAQTSVYLDTRSRKACPLPEFVATRARVYLRS